MVNGLLIAQGLMHDNEAKIDLALVRSLVDDQFPDWSGLPICAVASAGTENAIFRLGDAMVLRLPRLSRGEAQILTDHTCLPQLAGLPLLVPAPIALGRPGSAYPYRWAVHRWIDGEQASATTLPDRRRMAGDLGRFVRRLAELDADVPHARPADRARGAPLVCRDAETRAAISGVSDLFDATALNRAWERALAAPAYDGPPRLLHGDLHWGNLLARAGRLHAVIDWGCLAKGDPAPDLLPGWWLFDAEARTGFLDAVGPDAAMIERGRGWALSIALIGLAYYRDGRNPFLADMNAVAIQAVLDDLG